MSTQYMIKVVEGECAGQARVIGGAPEVLGRSRSATLQFQALDVSGKQVEFFKTPGGGVAMRSLGSRACFVNGRPVPQNQTRDLNPGDLVVFGSGNTVQLEVVGDEPDPGDDSTSMHDLAEATSLHAVPAPARDDDSTSMNETAATSFGLPAPVSRPADDEDRTSAEKTSASAATPPPKPAPAADADGDADTPREDATAQDDDDDEDGHTHAMHTRTISEDELDKIRALHKPRMKRSSKLLYAAIGAGAACLAVLWFVLRQDVENPLTWPGALDGNFNDGLLKIEFGATRNGSNNFYIDYPLCDALRIDRDTTNVTIMTRVGRHYDVPCRIILHMSQSPAHLDTSRAAGFEQWREQMLLGGGQWNFDAPSATVFCRREENGFPCQTAKYTRLVNERPWFGMVVYMRYADWELVLQKEIPASERYRGEEVLSRVQFFGVNLAFVRAHWEPPGALEMDNTRPVAELLGNVAIALGPASTPPRTWPDLTKMLRSALVRTLRAGDAEAHEEAVSLLLKLRARQQEWLNRQILELTNEKAAGLDRAFGQHLKSTLEMFPDENDWRCHMLRTRKWE